jgi:predicted GIY-YIG superfamily endonuclease
MEKGIVYFIKCIINNKIYVGSTKNHKQRTDRHLNDLKLKKHHSKHLQRSWDLYGEENFSFGILEETTINELLIKEEFWINKLKSFNRKFGYNILKKPKSREGVKHSEKSKKLISKNSASRGKYYEFSIRGSKKIYQYNINGDFIKEWLSIKEASDKLKIINKNISKCVLGERNVAGDFMWFDEFKGNKIPSYCKYKKVIQISLNGDIIKTYEKLSDVINENKNFTYQPLWSVCNNLRPTAYGFIWKYKNEYEKNKFKGVNFSGNTC